MDELPEGLDGEDGAGRGGVAEQGAVALDFSVPASCFSGGEALH